MLDFPMDKAYREKSKTCCCVGWDPAQQVVVEIAGQNNINNRQK